MFKVRFNVTTVSGKAAQSWRANGDGTYALQGKIIEIRGVGDGFEVDIRPPGKPVETLYLTKEQMDQMYAALKGQQS